MSQAKVDRHKEEKRNRAVIMRKEKRQAFLAKLLACVIMTAVFAWIVLSAWKAIEKRTARVERIPSYTADLTLLDEYLDGLAALEEN